MIPREMFDAAHRAVTAEARRRGFSVETTGERVRKINGKRSAVGVVPMNSVTV